MPPTQPPLHVEYAMFVQKNTLREELVKIAFRELLANQSNADIVPQHPTEAARIVVEYADAAMAEMEKETLVLDAKEPAAMEQPKAEDKSG